MRPIYLLDTNVLSELAKPRPGKAVVDRFFHSMHRSAVPTVAWGECLYGLKRIADSRRREMLTDFYLNTVVEFLPFIAFDKHAASIYSDIKSRLQKAGRPAPELDMQIASVAIANNMILVTRNVKDFEGIASVSALMLENWFS